MSKTAAEKARVKPGTKVALVDPDPEVVAAVGLEAPEFTGVGDAQLVFLFVYSKAELEVGLPEVVQALAPGSAVWVFFRKGSKAAGLDVNRDDIWAQAEPLGLRPLGLVGVDERWSVFRLRPGS